MEAQVPTGGHEGLTEAATASPAKSSLRRCIVTGESLPCETLLRFVVAPDGQVTPDFTRRLPGRGLWLSAEAAIVRKAVAKNLFAKAARRAVTVDPDLPDRVAAMARERFLDQIGLARRSGVLVSGHVAVRAALAQRHVKLLIEAADGAEKERRRLRAVAGDNVPCIDHLSAADLGRALGRDIAVHLAVTEQRWADRLSQRAALALALQQGSAT
ncbi:MAG: RNA-binding protein [Rhodospirillales bacterium]